MFLVFVVDFLFKIGDGNTCLTKNKFSPPLINHNDYTIFQEIIKIEY